MYYSACGTCPGWRCATARSSLAHRHPLLCLFLLQMLLDARNATLAPVIQVRLASRCSPEQSQAQSHTGCIHLSRDSITPGTA